MIGNKPSHQTKRPLDLTTQRPATNTAGRFGIRYTDVFLNDASLISGSLGEFLKWSANLGHGLEEYLLKNCPKTRPINPS